MSEVLIPMSDANDLDDVIRILGIEDSHTTPAEAVAEMFGTITRLSDANAELLAALKLLLGHSGLDTDAQDKDPEDHDAEKSARAAIAMATGERK